jgi:hypothetical protein
MAQVGLLRECQDIMGPVSACLVIIWSPFGRWLLFACISGMHCEMPSLWCPRFSADGILLQLSVTLCEKKFFLASRRGAGIRKFSRSTAALVTISISLAVLNHVSLFTLSLPTRIQWTCCMSSWCMRSSSVLCLSSLRRSS